jgi:MoxR-like ATPase
MDLPSSGSSAEDTWPGWGVYRGTAEAGAAAVLPPAPPWREFPGGATAAGQTTPRAGRETERGATYQVDRNTVELVNAALYLRRPLLVTGKPGTGKSTLAYAVARELGLGPVLRWNITSRTTLKDGVYQYDALGRLHDYNMKRQRPIGDYIVLGPLGTALLPGTRSRVLLIDEIDKADIDLPNDLLNVFEEGYFEIPELARETDDAKRKPVRVTSADGARVEVPPGRIYCMSFPFVVLTSNGERDFPPPFLRRCLRLYLPTPDVVLLARIVDAHLPLDPRNPRSAEWRTERQRLIADFVQRTKQGDLATDQLLNAVFMTIGPGAPLDTGGAAAVAPEARRRLTDALLRHLTSAAAPPEPTSTTGAGPLSPLTAPAGGNEPPA